MKLYIILISMLMSFTTTAIASSDDAWQSYYEEVNAACLKNSGLREAKPVSNIVSFDDNVGYDALVIKGYYPQPHMKNARARVLCLFNKKTKVTAISEMSVHDKN
jgi:hypothetical protein